MTASTRFVRTVSEPILPPPLYVVEAFLEATALKEAVFNPITADNDGQAGS